MACKMSRLASLWEPSHLNFAGKYRLTKKVFMRKSLLLVTVLASCYLSTLAQYGPGPGGGRYRERRQQQQRVNFDPSVNVSIGYGFPNLDSYLLDNFYGYYHGTATYTGPITASVDYRFNPFTSIGIMASYGKVSRSYYSFDSNIKTFSGSLTNVSIMLDFLRYLPGSSKVEPYTRAAIGINTGKSSYQSTAGTDFFSPDNGTSLAYQVGLGVQLYVSKSSGFFVEAGYGKYIVAAGLTFRFK
jgi:hypothetical protein